jgi:DNA polymerase-3 subunit delta
MAVLNNSSANGAYLFLGQETGKKHDAIDEIKKSINAHEETVFFAGETPVVNIVNTVQNFSLFAESRLFIVKNAEQIKKKDEIKLMASCIKELNQGTVLILVSDDYKLAAGLDDAFPGKNRRVFYEMFENEKNEWIRSFFKNEGFVIDTGGIDTILELVENNIDSLRRECSRLMLFLPRDRKTTAEDIEKWLSRNREESAFTLFSRIAATDSSGAIESLHALLSSKERPQSILAGLAWCFRKLRDYLALNELNSFELKKIGLSSPKAKSDYANAARRYNSHAADACLALTAEYDIRTRSCGAALESVLMDMYLVKVLGFSG